MPLDGDEFGKALPLCQSVGLTELPSKAVRNPDVPGFARLHSVVQSLHDVIKGRLVIPHMVDVEVHIVHPQVLQALIQHPPDVLLAADPRFDLLIGTGEKLGGHHNLAPLGKIPECTAYILFTGAALVGDSGIEEVDAQLQPTLDDLPGMRFVNGPGVLAILSISKSHAAHTNAGDVQVGIAEFCVFHIFSPQNFKPDTHAFRSPSFNRPLSNCPSMILAPGALLLRPAADLPRPLPPEVAKRTMVLPAKS